MRTITIVGLTLFGNMILWGFGFATGRATKPLYSIHDNAIYPGRLGCFNGHYEVGGILFGNADIVTANPAIIIYPCNQYNRFTQD